MNGNEEFSVGKFYGQVLNELTVLKDGQNRLEVSLHDFKKGIGERVESQGKELTTLNERMKVVYWLLAAIGVGIISATSKYLLSKLVGG